MSLATALAAARATQQTAQEDARTGTITIAGIDYACAIVRSPVQNEPTDSGWRREQTATVMIRKDLLTTVPTDDSTVYGIDGLEWFLVSVGGQDPTDIAWRLTVKRHLPNPT